MAKVTIFQFEMYNILSDAFQRSRRWATRDAIKRIGGVVIEQSGAHVDEAQVGGDIEGMTAPGFYPSATVGFQKRVTG
jgi:hypothetical protein